MSALGVIGNISHDTAEYPGQAHRQLLGGAALYIALAASRAGVTATPISVIGADLTGALRSPQLEGLDLTGVAIVDQPSCRFRMRYDHQHNLTAVDADYGAAELLTGHALDQAPHHRFIHVCCRRPLDPVPVLTALVARGQPFSIDFITASAAEMITATGPLLPYAQIIFTDISEYAVLTRTVDAADLRAATVTDGPRPVVLYRYGVQVAQAAVIPAEAVEVTGAGDTFTGTFLASTLRGEPQPLALRHAVHAATARVATTGIALLHAPP